MQQVQEPDEALFEAWRGGDMAAAERLVSRYEKRLYGFLYRMLGDSQEAEDAFQETFLRVHTKARKFKTGHAFRPWLYAIAANHCRDRMRRARRRPATLVEPARMDEEAGSAPRPDRIAEAGETARRLEEALAALPEKQRVVFLMARYDGLPYGEIAEALGIPVGTVKSRMNTAVSVLLRAIEDTQ